jgi:hypothetical protein
MELANANSDLKWESKADSLLSSLQDVYTYEPLEDCGGPYHSFRLLTLMSGEKTDDIKCQLKTFQLPLSQMPIDWPGSLPAYEALSYVWGSAERAHIIICNSRRMGITASLDTALRRLRRSHEPRILWIDQISVDQDNLKERSKQVQIMRNIFSRAHRVLKWLGEDFSDQAPLAIDLIKQMLLIDDPFRAPSIHFPTDEQLQKLGLPDRASPSWIAVETLLKLQYFTRIWIIQEVAVARNALLIWSNVSILWKDIRRFFYMAKRLNMHIRDRTREGPCPFLNDFRLDSMEHPHQTWINLLDSTSKHQATDARDRVFAIAGLAFDDLPFEVNYELQEAEVFSNAVKHIIRATGDLGVLCHTGRGCANLSDKLPCWASWLSNLGVEPFFFQGRGYNAAKSTLPDIRGVPDWKTLALNGLLGHAYTLLKAVEEVGERLRLVKIRYITPHFNKRFSTISPAPAGKPEQSQPVVTLPMVSSLARHGPLREGLEKR